MRLGVAAAEMELERKHARPRANVALAILVAALWIAAGVILAHLYLSRTLRVEVVAQGVDLGTTMTPADTIEARVEAVYGIAFVVHGAPEGSRLALEVVVTPPPGIVEPGASEPTREHRIPLRNTPVGERIDFGIRFTETPDLVPGRWDVGFWRGADKLGGTSFTVTLP